MCLLVDVKHQREREHAKPGTMGCLAGECLHAFSLLGSEESACPLASQQAPPCWEAGAQGWHDVCTRVGPRKAKTAELDTLWYMAAKNRFVGTGSADCWRLVTRAHGP